MTLREWFRESNTPKLALNWMITASATLFAGALFWRFFSFLYVVTALMVIGAGLILALFLVFEGIGATRSVAGVIPSVVMLGAVALVVCASGQLMWAGGVVVGNAFFRINEARYDAIVASVRRSPPADPGNGGVVNATAGGVRYVVDLGPPVRVAFVQPGGFLDNWVGVVYDPTGAVAEAEGWNADGTLTEGPVAKVFGGMLVECAPLRRSYYHCSFT